MGCDCRGFCDLRKRRARRQVCGIQLGPCIDDGENLRRLEVGKGQVMRRSKGYDIAFSSHGFSTE